MRKLHIRERADELFPLAAPWEFLYALARVVRKAGDEKLSLSLSRTYTTHS